MMMNKTELERFLTEKNVRISADKLLPEYRSKMEIGIFIRPWVEVGDFVLNYILNLLQACGQVSSYTSSLTLKRMLLRGKEFDGIMTLVNAEEIKHSLLSGGGSAKEAIQDKQRKLKFELQMKERELVRLEPYGTDSSNVPNVQIDLS